MTSHHGQRISFYDMAGIFGTAFLRTSTPDKAINGFRACGLWPFDDTIFQDNEFAAAAVTEEGPPTGVPHVVSIQTEFGGKGRPPKKEEEDQEISYNRSSDDEDKTWPCLVCGEPLSSSKSRGKWVQCQMCKKLAHEQCTPGYTGLICPNCESDED